MPGFLDGEVRREPTPGQLYIGAREGRLVEPTIRDIQAIQEAGDALVEEAVASGEFIDYWTAHEYANSSTNNHNSRRATSAWKFLRGNAEVDGTDKYVTRDPEELTECIFVSSYVIDQARRTAGTLNYYSTPPSVGTMSGRSPFFLVDLANDVLHADPPIPLTPR